MKRKTKFVDTYLGICNLESLKNLKHTYTHITKKPSCNINTLSGFYNIPQVKVRTCYEVVCWDGSSCLIKTS